MEDQGPFDRSLESESPKQRDRAAVVIVAGAIVLGIVLLLLVLPPISILDDGDGAPPVGSVITSVRDTLPAPPDGFEAVSPLYELSASEPVSVRALTFPLSSSVGDGVQLVLFTYEDDAWRLVGAAVSIAGGSTARGELEVLPANIAVFLPREQTRAVLGNLPAGAEPDERALPVLKMLNPAGYTPLGDGTVSGDVLVPPDLQVPVAPTIAARTPEAIDALNAILASPGLRAGHVEALLALAGEHGFSGIDLDYRTFDATYESDFVALIQDLSAGLRAENRSLTLTLPLPEQEDGAWVTPGFDWEAIAPAVDAIKLAPEMDQEQYYQRTEEALAFLVSRVRSNKLLLTVGPLSRERSVEGIRPMPLREALALAGTPILDGGGPVSPEATVRAVGQNLAPEAGGSALRWSDTSRSLVFTYTGPGGERTVWLANIFSESFRLDLARRYQLGGVVVEDVSRKTAEADIWSAVREYAGSGRVTLVKPNSEFLEPRWIASAGSLESDTGPVAIWHAPPEAGTYTLTLIVGDGVIRVGQELRVAVELSAVAP